VSRVGFSAAILLAAHLCAGLSGCAPDPKLVPIPVPPTAFKPRQEIEIWRDSKAVTLHGVRVLTDSLSGVPLWRSPSCDSCRVALPLDTIDSLRSVHTERSWMLLAGLPFVALGVFGAVWQLTDGD
jgi:hypothetical protein